MSVEKWLEKHEKHDDERFNEINTKLDMLLEAHNKQKGFVAGFAAAFTLLWTMLVGLAVYIWQRHFGG